MKSGILEKIRHLSAGRGADNTAEWKKSFFDALSESDSTVRAAVFAGASTGVPAFVFASGYQAAIRSVLPVDDGELASFCITEKEGASPRIIQADIKKTEGGFLLNGEKTFVTMAEESGIFFVCAHEGVPADKRKSFKIVKVEKMRARPPISDLGLPFLNEVSHSSVLFKDVTLPPEAVMPGDGYAVYVKPFRTVEDIHLLAAFAGFLLARGFAMRWPAEIMEKLAALVSALLSPVLENPDTPDAVIAVSGIRLLFDLINRESSSLKISDNPGEVARWDRDKMLFNVASKIRRRRTDSFWSLLASGVPE